MGKKLEKYHYWSWEVITLKASKQIWCLNEKTLNLRRLFTC